MAKLYYEKDGQLKKINLPPAKPKKEDIDQAVDEAFEAHKSEFVGTDALLEIGLAESVGGWENIDYLANEVNTKYMQFSGALADSTSIGYSFVNVTPNEVYSIKSNVYGYCAFYLFKDADEKVVLAYPTSKQAYSYVEETHEVTVPTNAVRMYFSYNLQKRPTIKRKHESGYRLVPIDEYNALGNVLYKKKWCVCGDSFTQGDFSAYVDDKGKSGIESDAWDADYGHYKTYPYWIRNRNKMDIQWLALCGSDFTNVNGASHPFSNPSTTNHNYTLIDADADYITFMFGLNETSLTDEEIGTKTDTTNTTLWGAYNVVLESVLTKNPCVKVGIIISDAWMTQKYHDALVAIAKYWGIPYLDLKNGENVPMQIGGRLDSTSSVAKTIKDNAFKCSSTNSHPNVKAHQYRSTTIENFLRSL